MCCLQGMSGERFILWYVDNTVALCSLVKGMSREVYIPRILIRCISSCKIWFEREVPGIGIARRVSAASGLRTS